MTMADSETQLILAAIAGLGNDIRASEGRLAARINDVAIVQDEHGERIVVIEQQCKAYQAQAQSMPVINWRRVFALCGIGGGAVSTPWFVHELVEFFKRG
jgi:hypothetical protein